MTDQPKPQVRGPLSPAEFHGCMFSDFSPQISHNLALNLDEALREALAEVERLRNELATTSKGSMTVERMQEQLLAASAENLRMRGEFERIVTTASKTSHHCYYSSVARDALASPPSELAAALMELVETCAQLIKARINMRDLSGPVHRVSLAHERVDAALEGKV